MWQLIILGKIILGNIGVSLLLKPITRQPGHKKLFVWLFFFSFIFSIIFVIINGFLKFEPFVFKPTMILIASLGALSSLATFCQWRAVEISQSKFALFQQSYNFVALPLAYWLLKEGQYLGTGLLIGMLLSLTAAILLVWAGHNRSKQKESSFNQSNKTLIIWIAFYSIVVGLAVFFNRYFALNGISLAEFLISWYLGDLIGASLIYRLSQKKRIIAQTTVKQIAIVAVISFLSWSTTFLSYLGAKFIPVMVSQSIYVISELVFPVLIGFFVFKEIKGLTRREKIAFVLGAAGAVTIGLTYRL